MIFVVAALLLAVGVFLIVRSNKEDENSVLLRWVGISIVIMSLFLIVISVYQIIDIEAHRVGH
ncbi:hypothetical protein BK126_09110 [Paenibacillus sp. FSL H7-0326]|uniref:hypothetical protein n=1 Tax=Paenibacillus sp. FSL H7-0326 TaxID=1921144 RepID=UPI00096FF51F|nr:hypothetical protein [Paenibacillus sp. FSL H7-0326]OMC72147.1 hypothetical protein BK126_09110 [Paenibacillus sp. FSL H7-0326]